VTELPEIEEIRRLELRPEDILVLRVAKNLRPDQLIDLKEQAQAALGVPNKIVVLSAGMQLDVLAPTEEPALERGPDVREALRIAEEQKAIGGPDARGGPCVECGANEWSTNLVGRFTCQNCGHVKHIPGVYA